MGPKMSSPDQPNVICSTTSSYKCKTLIKHFYDSMANDNYWHVFFVFFEEDLFCFIVQTTEAHHTHELNILKISFYPKNKR